MTTIESVCDFLETVAPSRLAETWDNIGLILGDAAGEATRIMTCLTVTDESADEAIDKGADLIVSHHPLPFKPVYQITTSKAETRLLWKLARAGVSIYSPHTGFDSAAYGINQQLADRLGLRDTAPLIPIPGDIDGLGSGRVGAVEPVTADAFVQHVRDSFQLSRVQFTPGQRDTITRVGIACGSGGSLLPAAIDAGCDAFVTGEATFHTVLECRAANVCLVLMGHYHSERFAVENLAKQLTQQFPSAKIWASDSESDPLTAAS